MQDALRKLVEEYPNHFGRMLRSDKYVKLREYLKGFRGNTLLEQVYSALYGETEHRCETCNKLTELISLTKGYRRYCSNRCQQDAGDRVGQAIKKLEAFGHFKYLSGYATSHSKVKVTNTSCGCTFNATYLNLFTNPNYCPSHGAAKRTEQLIEYMRTDEGQEKRRETFKVKRAEALDKTRADNEAIESYVLSSREIALEFLNDLAPMRSKIETFLRRFPRILAIINEQYGDRFGQKLYNYVHRINSIDDVPKCLKCLQPVNYKPASNAYNEFCSKTCSDKSTVKVERMKQTQEQKHGGWFLGTDEGRAKSRAMFQARYGVDNPLQVKEIQNRVWRSQFRLKSFTLPSGKVIKLQGYEPQVLEHLLKTEFREEDFEFEELPTFRWDDGKRFYFPDFYLPEHNLVIEVKSTWTLKCAGEATGLKEAAVRAAGYDYRLVVWD